MSCPWPWAERTNGQAGAASSGMPSSPKSRRMLPSNFHVKHDPSRNQAAANRCRARSRRGRGREQGSPRNWKSTLFRRRRAQDVADPHTFDGARQRIRRRHCRDAFLHSGQSRGWMLSGIPTQKAYSFASATKRSLPVWPSGRTRRSYICTQLQNAVTCIHRMAWSSLVA